MKSFMAFTVVLTRKGFATNGANERAFVGMRSKVRPEIVGSGEAFSAEGAFKSRGVFLTLFGRVASD